MALFHYGPDAARKDEFLSFVREHLEMNWLRESLRVSDYAVKIPKASRDAVLQLCDEYERRRT